MAASNCPDLAYPKPEPRARKKRREDKDDDKHEREVYQAVDRRDKNRCQLTGRRGNPYTVDPLDKLHHHHIIERSRLGPTETWNLVLVHRIVHDLINDSRIDVYGNADEQLTWTIRADAVEEAFGRKRVPLGVRVVAKEAWEAYIQTESRRRA